MEAGGVKPVVQIVKRLLSLQLHCNSVGVVFLVLFFFKIKQKDQQLKNRTSTKVATLPGFPGVPLCVSLPCHILQLLIINCCHILKQVKIKKMETFARSTLPFRRKTLPACKTSDTSHQGLANLEPGFPNKRSVTKNPK